MEDWTDEMNPREYEIYIAQQEHKCELITVDFIVLKSEIGREFI